MIAIFRCFAEYGVCDELIMCCQMFFRNRICRSGLIISDVPGSAGPALSADFRHFVRRRRSDPFCNGRTEDARIRRNVFFVFGLRSSHIPDNRLHACIPARILFPESTCTLCMLTGSARIPHKQHRKVPLRPVRPSKATICILPGLGFRY